MNFSKTKYYEIKFRNTNSDIMNIWVDNVAKSYSETSRLPKESFDYIIRNNLSYASHNLSFLEDISFHNISDAKNFLHEIEDQIKVSFKAIRLCGETKDSFKELFPDIKNVSYLDIKNSAMMGQTSPLIAYFENFIINGTKIITLSPEEYSSNYYAGSLSKNFVGAAVITVDFPDEIKFSSSKKQIITIDKEQGIYQQKISTSEITRTGEDFYSFIQEKHYTYNSNAPVASFRGKKCIGLFEIFEKESQLFADSYEKNSRNLSELDLQLLSLSDSDKDKVLQLLKIIN